MTPPTQVNDGQSVPSRVSILARLIPAFSYAIPAVAAALSAILFMNVMRAMRLAASLGIAAVSGGMAEANLPTLIALYLAIFVGVIGIVVAVVRLFISTTTASPSAWFFLIGGGLGLAPVALLWEAESLLLQFILPLKVPGISYSGEGAELPSSISQYLMLTLITAAVGALILLVASLVPLPSALRARRNYAPLVVLVVMELALIGMAVAFQVRTSWFHQVAVFRRIPGEFSKPPPPIAAPTPGEEPAKTDGTDYSTAPTIRNPGSTGEEPAKTDGTDYGRVFSGSEVNQKAYILSKPEAQYTEEARKNRITGTVVLRAVFSSSGQITNISAVSTLPDGLTERAIVAAKKIKFVPATKDGRPVSMWMQLEYDFKLH